MKVHILFVEDETDDVQLMLRRLRQDGFEPEWTVSVSETELREAAAGQWQVALVDYHLPGFGGLEAATLLAELAPDLPVIIVSGTIDEEVAVQTMRAGAVDYVLKDNLTRLGHAVRRAIEEAGLRREYRRSLDRARVAQFALDNASFPITMLAADGKLAYANEQAIALMRYPRERLAEARLWELDTNQTPEQFQAFWRDVQARRVLSAERVAVDADGDERVLTITANYLDTADSPTVVAYSQDVTEARRLESQARESEARFSRLAALVPGIVMLLEGGDRIVYANKVARELLAMSAERIIGKRLDDVIPAQVLPLARAYAQRVAEGDIVDEYVGYDAGGLTVRYHVLGVPVATAGGVTTVAFMALDVSELWRAEDSARATAERLRRTLEGSVLAMSQVVETRDPYTAGHERRVAELAGAIAEELGWRGDELSGLRLGALIHDIGKIAVPAEILSKPGRLSEAEFNLIKQHSQAGSDILATIEFDRPVAEMVRQHHERLDGSGYPRGLKAAEILPEAKILAVADVVEAMSSHRPYRPALGMEPALREIRDGAGTRYDVEVAGACLRVVRRGFSFSA